MLSAPLSLRALVWSPAILHQALPELAYHAGYVGNPAEIVDVPEYPVPGDDGVTDAWMNTACARLGLESEAVRVTVADLSSLLRGGGPMLLRVTPEEGRPGFLAVLRGGRRNLIVVDPLGRRRRVLLNQLADHLRAPLEQPIHARLRGILSRARVTNPEQVLRAMTQESLQQETLAGCWLLRQSPGERLGRVLRNANVPWDLAGLLGSQLALQALLLAGWMIIGGGSLEGYFEWENLTVWALILFTMIPFQLASVWGGNGLSIKLGAIFKERLLFGILRLRPEAIRHQGSGGFLGLVMEAELLESLASGGGFIALLAVVELGVAAWVLGHGAGGWGHAASLGGWLITVAGLGWLAYRSSAEWMVAHRGVTADLVERMAGQRTRLAQEDPARWHHQEDILTDFYLRVSQRTDQHQLWFRRLTVLGWLVIGFAGLSVPFAQQPEFRIELAIGVGGILLATQALEHFMMGWLGTLHALIAWQQVAGIFQSAGRTSGEAGVLIQDRRILRKRHHPLATLDRVSFHYPGSKNVLERCGARIGVGDRILLQGPSGGGKSTLAALLAGLETPTQGRIQLWGLERGLLGDHAWRRRIVTALQFHENHILTDTLAFNLFMGRGWPPSEEDLIEAETLCRTLGLGALLDRMPAGLQQMIGESGWQLSHGEQSRVFIARALLQQADLLILDESFAALDPLNLTRVLHTVKQHAPSMLVIAHP